MQRNEPLQAVYKGLSSHSIKSSYVVIWYMILSLRKTLTGHIINFQELLTSCRMLSQMIKFFVNEFFKL